MTLGFDELVEMVSSKFRDINQLTKARLALANLSQGGNSVAYYTAKFRSLTMELGDEAPNKKSSLFNFV